MADRVGVKGQSITIYVGFTDSEGAAVNADAVPQVEVTDTDGAILRILNKTGVSQVIDSVGLYSFTYKIPLTTIDGYHQDRWVALIGGQTVTSSFQFLVIDGGSIAQDVEATFTPDDTFSFDFSKAEVTGINKLIHIMSKRLKSSGTRQVDDGAGGTTTVACNIFSNDEMTCFLVNSLSEFNQWPHFTSFTFAESQTTGIFLDIIIQGAVLLALAAQTLIERGREFQITDNGVTYQPPAVSEILNSQYGTQLGYYKEKLKAIKTSLKPAPYSLGTFRVTSISPNYIRLRHLRQRQII